MICCAVAAGITSSAKTSSAPVIWLTSAAAQPSRTRKTVLSSRTGTPRAAATSGSTVAKNNGRAISASTAIAAAATASRTRTWLAEMPRKEPNSRPVSPLRKPPYRLTNRAPQASANACTVPMMADSLLPARPPSDLGTAAITSAAAIAAVK